MPDESLKLVIVGHVDHGKSTLIGRLFYDTDSLPNEKMEEIRAASQAEGRELEFGYIMDHLREERSRGITIDTAQCFFTTQARNYVIIDAPGHVEFLKNMVTGASQAEAAILICSVSEGVQEQTRRHAYLLKLLGLSQVIVAYNKMDLVDYQQSAFGRVRALMEQFLARIGIGAACSIPISARLGDNVARRSAKMPWYDGPTILEALDTFRKAAPAVEKPLRFPVQDVYSFNGQHIVAGRVESGVLERGATLQFLPEEITATVREVLKYGEDDIERAEAGECIGVVLDRADLRRGQVGFAPGQRPPLASSFQASVFWLSPRPFTMGEQMTLRCSTQQRPCRISAIHQRIDSSSLEPLEDASRLCATEVGEVSISTATPMVVQEFQDVPELGRFVLQRDREVVGGGIITFVETSNRR